jgi:hypothetical protein
VAHSLGSERVADRTTHRHPVLDEGGVGDILGEKDEGSSDLGEQRPEALDLHRIALHDVRAARAELSQISGMLEDPNLLARFKEQIGDRAPHVSCRTHDRNHRYLLVLPLTGL